MSLTSYRAAPPRVNWDRFREARDLFFLIGFCAGLFGSGAKRFFRSASGGLVYPAAVGDLDCEEEDWLVFGRPGGDLLSRVLRQSTIGAEAFDGRVRDGIGSGHFARATRPA